MNAIFMVEFPFLLTNQERLVSFGIIEEVLVSLIPLALPIRLCFLQVSSHGYQQWRNLHTEDKQTRGAHGGGT